jgi:flagellar hook-length control protein FliK
MNPIMDMVMVMPQANVANVEQKMQLKQDTNKPVKDESDFSKVIAAVTEAPEKRSDLSDRPVLKTEQLSDEEKAKLAAASGAGGIVNLNVLMLFQQVPVTTENVNAEVKITTDSLTSATTTLMNHSSGIAAPVPSKPVISNGVAEIAQTIPIVEKSDDMRATGVEKATELPAGKMPVPDVVAPALTQAGPFIIAKSDVQQTFIQQPNPAQNLAFQSVQPAPSAATADTSQIAAVTTSMENRPQLINPADVVAIKTANDSKAADTINLEVAPGIERMRIQPIAAGLANSGEQTFSDDGTTFVLKQPLAETLLLKPDETIPEFSLPTAISQNGFRTDNVGAIPVQAPPATDQHSVYRQVLDGMTTAGAQMKTSEIIITLKPEQLGEVTVKISVDGNRVAAVFHSANPEVRGILESSMTQLRQEMSQQGWQFDHGGVYGEMNGFLGQQNRQQQDQQLADVLPKKRQERYDPVDSTTPGHSANLGMTAMSVDYRV